MEINSTNNNLGKKAVSIAKEWLGKNFNPLETEQCCYFVRHIYSLAGKKLGITEKPSDNFFPTGTGYANSLAGNDIGIKITKISDLREGDLVFFKNTYGNWPDGTITHVGIYSGDGEFIHRTTSSLPIEKQKLSEYHEGENFFEGRRII